MFVQPPVAVLVPLCLVFAFSFGRAGEVDSDSRPLRGVVVAASGEPAADVDVWLATVSLNGDPEIYDHTKTAADGTFRLTVPGRWTNQTQSLRQELGVVAFQSGAAPAVVGFYRSSPLAPRLQMELKPIGGFSLRVLAPDGRPVAGAKVTVTALGCGAIRGDLSVDAGAAERFGLTYATGEMRAALKFSRNGPTLGRMAVLLPAKVSDRLSAQTAEDGKVLLPVVALEDVAAIKIATRDYGTQIAALQNNPGDFQHEPRMSDTIMLRPVGSLAGRLVSDPRAQPLKAAIRVRSFAAAAGSGSKVDMSVCGVAEVAAGDDGRFEIPTIAAGAVDMAVSLPKESPLRIRLPENRSIKIKPGEPATVSLPMTPGIRASGRVRSSGTKRPLAGITVQVLHGINSQEVAVTDGEGRYNCLVTSGAVLSVPIVPSAFAPLSREALGSFSVTIPEGKKTFELPLIELTPLAVVRGVVMDGDGRPAANAAVQARWQTTDRRHTHQTLLSRQMLADDQGRFVVAGVDADHEVLIEARTATAFGRIKTTSKKQGDDLVVFTIREENLVALSGRVVDTSGQPVSGRAIEIWGWLAVPDDAVSTPERVTFAAGVELRTDAEGRYQTPRELDRESMHQARLATPNHEAAATFGLCAAVAGKLTFDDLVVRRVATISGRVEDRQGRGVAGAAVFQSGDAPQRLKTTTDAAGRFRLEGAKAAPTFLFVSQPGFRFFGQLLGDDEDGVVLVVTRDDEAAEAWRTLPLAMSKDERLALARRVLKPCLEKIGAEKEGRAAQTLAVYGAVDPEALLARLAEKPPKNPFLAGYVRRAAAKALADDDIDEAIAVIETIEDSSFRSTCYLDIVDLLSQDQRPRKLELLAQATLAARATPSPEMRALQLGAIAERLLDLGQRDQAVALLRDGEKLARELPLEAFGGYARGAFAEELGQVDLPAALELMKGLKDDYEFDRHHGNLAHELAGKNPAEAERLLDILHGTEESKLIAPPRDMYGVRVCYRMAPVDLPRARRIAKTMTDRYLQARAYGVMAQALAKREPQAARELLARAFNALAGLVDARETDPANGETQPAAIDRYNGLYSAASVAGSLLPAVEAVDATLVPEYFWRAASFRLPGAGDEAHLVNDKRSNAALAMMLARYNRDVAAGVFKLAQAFGHGRDPGLMALALIDPARAAAEAEANSADDNTARVQLARLLALEGDALWRKLNGSLALWSIDEEDIVGDW